MLTLGPGVLASVSSLSPLSRQASPGILPPLPSRKAPAMARRVRLPLGVLVLVGLAAVKVPRAATVAQLPDPPIPRPLQPAKKADPHPLDPLSKEEIRAAVAAVRDAAKMPRFALVPFVALNEPAKAVVLAHKPGAAFPRDARLVIFDRETAKTYEAVVDLRAGNGGKLTAFAERKGVQPSLVGDDFNRGATVVRDDPGWQRAMMRRGFTRNDLADEKLVEVQSWGTGHVPGHAGKRLVRAVTCIRGGTANPFPRVVEGLVALVDLTNGTVLELLDEGDTPVPTDAHDFFDPKRVGKLRDPLRPLEARQPQGANFELHGHEIRWQNWSLRHSFHPREGLVLHAVSYKDGETVRPILYRASMNEMLVPYGDAGKAWNWRNAFDIGEYGFGPAVTKLRPGREVPDNATVLPVVQANEWGSPEVVDGRVAIYEQDGGILWTHTDYLSGKVETRRARQLVLQSLYTLGNYDYGVRWLFGQDGSIDVQVELTGIVLTKAVKEKACVSCQEKPDKDGRLLPAGADRHGVVVAPQIVAAHHQHFFNFRLDFDLEGAKNSVHEMELVAEAKAANPAGNAFIQTQQQLRTEKEARRDTDARSHRTWKVLNPNRRTALGHFPAYELIPGATAVPFVAPESAVRKRAEFVGHPVWVTTFKPAEKYAAGDYPNQSAGGDGLPAYIADNEPLLNEDVVLWHTVGVTHAARAEEWPVMPVTRAAFRLIPHNFFDRNPALDVR